MVVRSLAKEACSYLLVLTPIILTLSRFPGTCIYISLDSFSCKFQKTQIKRLEKNGFINVCN